MQSVIEVDQSSDLMSEYTVVPRYNEQGDGPYHPDFSSPDGDIILASKDCKVMFRTHTYILKTTSGFFRSMFCLPRRSTASDDTEVIYLNDDDRVLEHLLRIVSGLPLPQLDSCDLVERVLHAAEGYEMPGAVSVLRLAIAGPLLASADPIRMYGICVRYGWEDEAKQFSTRTLSLNLYDEQHRDSLERLPSPAMWRLYALHRSRREHLRRRLDDPPFVSGKPALCAQCSGVIEYHTWRELKYKIILEMDQKPLGDTVSQGLVEWPEAKACWRAGCPNPLCGRLLYDKPETVRVIKEAIDELPNTV